MDGDEADMHVIVLYSVLWKTLMQKIGQSGRDPDTLFLTK